MATLALLRVALRLTRLGAVRRLATLLAAHRADTSLPIHRVAWAVRAADRFLPGSGTCLPMAMTGSILLKRYGHDARLALGVARVGPGVIQGHAWVECRGEVLLGGGIAERFASLDAGTALL